MSEFRRRLMIGVGGAEPVSPVFYPYLVFDGAAYIDTDIYPQENSSYVIPAQYETLNAAQRLFMVDSSNAGVIGTLLNSSTNATNRQLSYYYNSGSSISTRAVAQNIPGYSLFMTPNGEGVGTAYANYTKGNTHPNGHLIIGSNNGHDGQPYTGVLSSFRIYGSDAQNVQTNADFNNYTPYVQLRLCKYGEQSGYWNVEENKFYGNTAGAGTLVAADRLAVNPSSYDNTDYSYYSLSNASNAYSERTSSTYATINLTRGANAVTYIYFKFDTSSIPADAKIVRVLCYAKAAVPTTGQVTTRTMRVYSGTTPKGTAVTVGSSATIYKLTTEAWTRQEAEDIRIKIYAIRGTSNTTDSRTFRFYGAGLYVFYTL